jgi:hypothetical protein
MILLPQITPKTGLAASVQALFANNEQGAWYDPSDSTTLFQDQSGTTPVTAVEQPVSLMLDKSKGLVLGSEVVVNGDFATDTVWTKGTGWTIGSGVATASSSANLVQAAILTIGKWYKVSVDVVSYTTGPLYAGTISNLRALPTGAGTRTIIFLADATSFYLSGLNAFTGSIDNISVKELAGNHAYTPSTATASRPVLSARVNLLEKTEQFNDGYWSKTNASVTENAETAPNGTDTADKLIENTSNSTHETFRIFSLDLTTTAYTFSCYVKAAERTSIQIAGFRTASPFAQFYGRFNLSDGTTIIAGGASGGTLTGSSITSAGNGWYKISVSGYTGTSGAHAFSIYILNNDNSPVYTGTAGLGVYIWGADLRLANDGVGIPYQRVNTSTDYDSDPAKFPRYLRFDGSDDYMLTNSVNFTGTDKVTLWAGVRKLSDGANGAVIENSVNIGTNNGVFTIQAPQGTVAPLNHYTFATKGTNFGSATTGTTGYSAPITSVLTGLGDISGDSSILRINGTQAATSTDDQGTGNFGNYPLYIGRRGGTTIPFNGRIFSLIIRGAQSTTQQIEGGETYVNTKTRAF